MIEINDHKNLSLNSSITILNFDFGVYAINFWTSYTTASIYATKKQFVQMFFSFVYASNPNLLLNLLAFKDNSMLTSTTASR